MAPFFVERERAAEGIYVRDEELRFLSLRRGLEVLGYWAADAMALDPDESQAYARRLVDALVAGTPEAEVVTSVQLDLERAGKPALSTNVTTVLAQAVAEASETLRHGPSRSATQPGAPIDVRSEWDRHHQKPGSTWGWSL